MKSTRLLLLGDIHGGIDAVRKVVAEVRGLDLVAVLCVGDFASTAGGDVVAELETIAKVFESLASLGVVVVYTWGNRDLMLFERIVRLGDECARKRAREIVEFILSLDNVYESPSSNRLCLQDLGLCITSSPSLADRDTILLVHYVNYVHDRALLHVEGHVHYGQLRDRYINAGFVYRDDLHGARAMEGMYMLIELEGRKLENVEVRFLTEDLRFLQCPLHIEEGTFIVPKWWRRCPVCYDIARAKFTKQAFFIDSVFQGVL